MYLILAELNDPANPRLRANSATSPPVNAATKVTHHSANVNLA